MHYHFQATSTFHTPQVTLEPTTSLVLSPVFSAIPSLSGVSPLFQSSNTQGEHLEAIAIGQDLAVAPSSCILVEFEAGIEIGHPERIPSIANPYEDADIGSHKIAGDEIMELRDGKNGFLVYPR